MSVSSVCCQAVSPLRSTALVSRPSLMEFDSGEMRMTHQIDSSQLRLHCAIIDVESS